MPRIIFFFVLVLVDFTNGEDSPNLNKSIVSDDVVKADRILKDFDASLNYLTSNIGRLALPVMLKINEEVKVSRSCVRAGMRLLADLKQNKGWTVKLLDSLGKPLGILGGKTWLHGDYDQCLNIEVKDDKIKNIDKRINTFYGKFCSVNFGFNSYKFSDAFKDIRRRKMYKMLKDSLQPFPASKFLEAFSYLKVDFRMDICIPSTCNQEDVENVLRWAFRDPYRAKVNFCKVKDQKITLSTTQIICIIAISIFIPWVIIGTILETLCKFNIINASCNKGDYLHSFVAVSLRTSTQKLFSTDFNQKTRFFCGMKCLVNCLSVFVHIVFYSGFIYSISEKSFNIGDISEDIFIEASYEVFPLIETFFILSGFLTYYLRRNDEKQSIMYYFNLLFKRYFRLTFPLLCVLAFFIILPLCGEGPHWDLVNEEARKAEQYWWRHILHIWNLYSMPVDFFIHIWFVNVLMQLTIITVPLLYIHDRWPTFGTIVLCVFAVTGIISHVCQFLSTKFIAIVGLSMTIENVVNMLLYIYQKPYFTHLSSYCLGLILGYAFMKNNQFKFRKTIIISCWITTILLTGLILFGLHQYRNDPSPNESIILAHQILSPIASTAVTAWICVACLSGYGGVANKFLSLDVFVVMDRLTTWIYLLHPIFILYLFGEFRSPLRYTRINLYMMYLLVMTLSIIASVFCYVFLEIPFSYLLSKILLSETSKKKISNNNENHKMQTVKKWNLPIFHRKTLQISESKGKRMED